MHPRGPRVQGRFLSGQTRCRVGREFAPLTQLPPFLPASRGDSLVFMTPACGSRAESQERGDWRQPNFSPHGVRTEQR